MAVPLSNLNMVEKTRNITDECFQSRSTVLQGQAFGGIPTVLILNIFLWVVSPGLCGGQGGREGHTGQLSQVTLGGGSQLSKCTPALVVGTSECQSHPGQPWEEGTAGIDS